MRSRKLLALLFCLITFPAIAGYMTLLGAGVGSIAPVVSWVSTTDPTFPSSSLTYSGPSLSTMFDSTGKLIYKPNNLLTYSNTFSNAAWLKLIGGTGTNPVVTANAGTDPLGGNAAWRFQADRGAGGTSSDYSLLFQDLTFGTQTKGLRTLWVKSNTGSSQTFVMYDGTARAVGQTFTATTLWQQVALADSTGTASLLEFLIGTRGGTGSYFTGGQQTLDLLIYAGTASAVTYETSPRPGDQVITTSSAYYGPRIDYDPNTLAVKGLLIEEARTNYCPYSSALSSWSPTNGTVTNNSGATLDPSGLNTATLVNPTGGSNTFLAPPAFTASGSTQYTASYFVKSAGAGFVQIAFYDGTNALLYVAGFNLSTGANVSTTAGVTALPSVNVGNGWWRLSATWTSASNTATIIPVVYPKSDAGGASPALSDKIYVWGPQYEKGAATSSYVANLSTGTTARAADVVQFTGAALTALQGSAWSAIVEIGTLPGFMEWTTGILGLNDSQRALYVGVATQLASWNGSSARVATIGSSGNFTTGSVRSAIATDASGRTIVANGGTVSTDGNKAAPTAVTSANLGALDGGAFPINGPVKSFAIYNQRLPDATLQAKSVVGASYAANDNGIRYAFADNDNLPIHWRVAL